MARPFISWSGHLGTTMSWLRELLSALGFEKPIVLDTGGPLPPVGTIRESFKDADCVFALVAPVENEQEVRGVRASDWVLHELTAAVLAELPIGALVDRRVEMPEHLRQSFSWIPVDFRNPEEVLQATPRLVEMALKTKRFLDHDLVSSDSPSIYEEIHVVNNVTAERWQQTRSILLTARQGFGSQCDHAVDLGMDKSAGLSVRLANPQTDLSVTVNSRERFKPKVELVRNDDAEVRYIVTFEPKLRRGDSVRYRHKSTHPNVYPLTQAEVRERAARKGSPPFMRDGLVGDSWDVRRMIGKLIMELQVHVDMGFSEPELRVYTQDAADEYEEERRRIGTQKVAPKLWQVWEDHNAELWICRVTIPTPPMGRTYALLARPPET